MQLCSGILLEEGMRIEFLKKMRRPKMEPMKKSELMKVIVKKCNSLTTNNRPVKCSKCGFINGLAHIFPLDTLLFLFFWLDLLSSFKSNGLICYALQVQ